MSSSIFTTMLKRQIDLFVATFQNDGNALFKNERNALIHPGEYGMYREQRFRVLLQAFLTRDNTVSDGFIISSVDDHITTQCDILVHNALAMPLTDGGLGKFYPVEDVRAIIEMKSDLDYSSLKKALRKLAEVKMIGDERKNPSFTRYADFLNHDTIPTYLVCNKLIIKDLDAIDFESIYDGIDRKYWHNGILSVQDGVFSYAIHVADMSDYSRNLYESLKPKNPFGVFQYQYPQHIIKVGESIDTYNCPIDFDPVNRSYKYDHIMLFLMLIKHAIDHQVKYYFDSSTYVKLREVEDTISNP